MTILTLFGQKTVTFCTFQDKTDLKITSFELIPDPFLTVLTRKWTLFDRASTTSQHGRKVLLDQHPWARLGRGPRNWCPGWEAGTQIHGFEGPELGHFPAKCPPISTENRQFYVQNHLLGPWTLGHLYHPRVPVQRCFTCILAVKMT